MNRNPNQIRALGVRMMLVAALVLAFQNCGELRPSTSAVQEQASMEARYRRDRDALTRLLPSATLKVWSSAKESTVTRSGAGVSSVSALRTGASSLVPAASESGPQLSIGPSLGQSVLDFDAGKLLRSDTITANAYSVLALVDDSFNGKVISLTTTGDTGDQVSISASSGTVTVVHQSDALNAMTYSAPLPSGPAVVAVSLGSDPSQVHMQVNGVLATAPGQKTGTPTRRSELARTLVLGDAAAGSSLKLGEIMVFSESLTKGELNSVSRFLGERWGFGGVIYDPSLYPAETDENEGALPADIKVIISNRCVSCHMSTHASWATFKVEDFVRTGRVVPGDPAASALYTRLDKSAGDASDNNMPLGGTIEQAEVDAIRDWILGLK